MQIRKKVEATNIYKAKKCVLAHSFDDQFAADDHLAEQVDYMHRLFAAGKLTTNSKGRL